MKTNRWQRRRWVVAASVAAAWVWLVGGCDEARVGEPLTEPVMLSNQRAVLGQQVFMAQCHQCHPGGAGGLAPPINDKPLPEGMIKMQVRRGLGAMPAFDKDKISDEELDAVAEYLKELRKGT